MTEPTSGMDPYSRRFTWSIIRKYREVRGVRLTGLYMYVYAYVVGMYERDTWPAHEMNVCIYMGWE